MRRVAFGHNLVNKEFKFGRILNSFLPPRVKFSAIMGRRKLLTNVLNDLEAVSSIRNKRRATASRLQRYDRRRARWRLRGRKKRLRVKHASPEGRVMESNYIEPGG